MTDIDWTRAPEWATKHGSVGCCGDCPIWFNDKQYTYCDGRYGGRAFLFSNDCTYKTREIYSITERPAQPWTGDGLPPVGTECDCRVKAGAEWVPCVIVAHHKHYAIAYVDDDTVMLSCGIRFRPRRTPAQIAADERKASIESMIAACPYPGSNSTAIDCAALYDAGLRFPKGDDQ